MQKPHAFGRCAARLTFAARLAIGTALILVASGLFLLVSVTINDALNLSGELERQLQQEMSGLAAAVTAAATGGDESAIGEILRERMGRTGLPELRRLAWYGPDDQRIEQQAPAGAALAPAWFVRSVAIADAIATRPLAAAGRDLGRLTVVLAAGPGIDHLWQRFLSSLQLLAMAIGVQFAGMALILRLGLRPLNELAEGVRRFGDGQHEVRLAPLGSPEMQQITTAFNAMAEKLSGTLQALRQSHDELRIAATAFESEEGMIVTDDLQGILRVNRAFVAMTGYPAEQVLGKSPRLLLSREHDDAFYQRIWQVAERERHWQGELQFRHAKGHALPVWQGISAVVDEHGAISHFVIAFSDLSQRKEAEEKIRHLAFYDPLTELPNRRLLLDRLSHALATAARQRQHGALLFLDFDQFKLLNDTEGHDAGDELLIEISRRLRNCVRQVDTVARLGGDEFVVLLENLGDSEREAAEHAGVVGQKILEAIARPFLLKRIEHHGSMSIGIGLFDDSHPSVDEILKRADVAMYKAKSDGRNRVCFFDPAMQQSLMKRAEMEGELRRVISEGRLVLHYQPQFDDQSRIIGAEALLRWQHPLRGLVPPAEFIPLAEETGLIIPIGQWVLMTVCRQLCVWQEREATRDLVVSVNVSARQFHQPDFVEGIEAILRETGAEPTRLKLELTESVIVDDIEDTILKMKTLKGLGIGLSMDDFGTGYSSLSYLRQLPLDQLKIDRSFITQVDHNASDAEIVRTIISMAQALGLQVIAEGVENKSQHHFLDANDCDAYQGFLFGHPVPAAVIEKMFDN